MIDRILKIILISLICFTPVAFGSMDLWAFSLMELGILLMIVLTSFQEIALSISRKSSDIKTVNSNINTKNLLLILLLFLFLALIFSQLLSLPPGWVKVLSPKTHALRESLSLSFVDNSQRMGYQLSLFPLATLIELLKWISLVGFFLLMLYWKHPTKNIVRHVVPVIMLVGIAESLYGIFEFISGHRHILYLDAPSLVGSVTGTFINRNYFAGYLLMVIPLSLGYFLSKKIGAARYRGWRYQLTSLDGKSTLIAFGIILMILALLLTASRMGIAALLLSFSVIIFLFRGPGRERRFSGTAALIFGLAILWAAWIGLDTAISRFFATSEDFESRWTIWADTFAIVKDFPLFGSGLGTFTQVFPLYRSDHIIGLRTHAENDFLQLASEVGLIGIGILFIICILVSYRVVSGMRSLASESQRYIATGGMIGLVALMFHSLVERNIQVPSNAFLFTLILAMVLRIADAEERFK